MLEYKRRRYGTEFVKVDRGYPSSRTDSGCGAVKASLLLSERTYRCTVCEFEADRDWIAAWNIRAYPVERSPPPHAWRSVGRASACMSREG